MVLKCTIERCASKINVQQTWLICLPSDSTILRMICEWSPSVTVQGGGGSTWPKGGSGSTWPFTVGDIAMTNNVTHQTTPDIIVAVCIFLSLSSDPRCHFVIFSSKFFAFCFYLSMEPSAWAKPFTSTIQSQKRKIQHNRTCKLKSGGRKILQSVVDMWLVKKLFLVEFWDQRDLTFFLSWWVALEWCCISVSCCL